MLFSLLETMRPRQWPKNGFVFVALLFDRQLDQPESILQTIAAFVLLCLMSGAVYTMNDLADIESDRQHPRKKHRPLPSGRLSSTAAGVAVLLLALGSLVAGFLLAPSFAAILLFYLVLQIAYTFWLKRVVLVDADLRRPSQHLLFDVPNEQGQGLMTMMMDDAKMQTPPLVATDVEGLWLLLSGPQPPNPAELLSSGKMGQIIEILTERADIVLFDAPPVMPVTDAAILASKTDGVLLVLQAGATKREHARQARERLEQVNARLIGSVLTNVEMDSTTNVYG